MTLRPSGRQSCSLYSHCAGRPAAVLLAVLLAMQAGIAAEHAASGAEPLGEEMFGRPFSSEVRPLLKKYCFECHEGEQAEADIDFAPFQTLDDVRTQLEVWQQVREMLDSSQMPPNDATQPTDAERDRLQQWTRRFLAYEARRHAGDPGPVVLRRLTGAEYTYTVRDLTGVDSLDPTREFPVDGAAGEGFTNTGAGQGMSPSLAAKYLQAAKEIAEHAVLLPDGIRFSTHTTRRDRTDELLAQIQAFYNRYTKEGGGLAVDLLHNQSVRISWINWPTIKDFSLNCSKAGRKS